MNGKWIYVHIFSHDCLSDYFIEVFLIADTHNDEKSDKIDHLNDLLTKMR